MPNKSLWFKILASLCLASGLLWYGGGLSHLEQWWLDVQNPNLKIRREPVDCFQKTDVLIGKCLIALDFVNKKELRNAILTSQPTHKIHHLGKRCFAESDLASQGDTSIDVLERGVLLVSVLPKDLGTELGMSCLYKHERAGTFVYLGGRKNLINWSYD